MESTDARPHRGNDKLLKVLCVLFGCVHMIDFLFYGQGLRNLLGGIGFALLAHSIHRRPEADTAGPVPNRVVSTTGVVLVLASTAMQLVGSFGGT